MKNTVNVLTASLLAIGGHLAWPVSSLHKEIFKRQRGASMGLLWLWLPLSWR